MLKKQNKFFLQIGKISIKISIFEGKCIRCTILNFYQENRNKMLIEYDLCLQIPLSISPSPQFVYRCVAPNHKSQDRELFIGFS